MDDPISALDTKTRKKIFQRVFRGMLENKTRILCTHAIDFVHLADKVVVMKEGTIKVQGTFEEVRNHEIVKEIFKIHNQNKLKVEEKNKGKDTKDEDDEPDTPVNEESLTLEKKQTEKIAKMPK